jgi:hypothetical protein
MDKLLVPLLVAGVVLALVLLLLLPSPTPLAPARPILIEVAGGTLEMAIPPVPASLARSGMAASSVNASDAAGLWGERLDRPAELADLAAKSSLSVCVEHAAGLFGGSLGASPAAAWVADGGAFVLLEHAAGTFAFLLKSPSASLAGEAGDVPRPVLVEHAAGAFGERTSLPADSTEVTSPSTLEPTAETEKGILIEGADGLQVQRLVPSSPAIESAGAAQTGGNP